MDLMTLRIKNSLIRKDIVKLINKFNNLRQERNNINKLVQESKEKRESSVNKIKSILNELKELNKEKNSINVEDIKRLRNLINKKEWFFQINALSIKKEEALMKEIKGLNQKLKTAEKTNQVILKIKQLIKDLELNRMNHNSLHKIVIEKAEESNSVSDSMKLVQKNIKKLKKEGKIISEELKKEELERKKMEGIAKKRAKSIKQKKETIIKQKQEELLDKLKSKKKLTTDDLIFFQK